MIQMPLSEEELNHLKKTMPSTSLPMHDPIWKNAFKVYNEAHGRVNPLQMHCRPCYMKVLLYCLTNQPADEVKS